MEEALMKIKLAIIALALLIGSLQVRAEEQVQGKQAMVAAVQKQEAETEHELEYFELVMNIFRYHVKALELLSAAENKYSDNVVSHANAIWHTSGLLDHIYPGEAAMPDREWPWKTEKEFQERAQANRKAAKALRTAAKSWLEKEDGESLRMALENLKDSCRNCHGEARDWP